MGSFQITAGMLSGPKALEDFKFLMALFNSVTVNSEVGISRVSVILSIGS